MAILCHVYLAPPLNSTGTVFALEDQTQLMAIPRHVYQHIRSVTEAQSELRAKFLQALRLPVLILAIVSH